MAGGRGACYSPPAAKIMNDQPQELREYLADGEALLMEWYSRDGLEPSHEHNIDRLATLMVLSVVMSSEQPFSILTGTARMYLTAAFQMGRACGHG